MLKNRSSKRDKSCSNSHNCSTPQLTDAEDYGWLDFFSSPLTTRLLNFSEEVSFLDHRNSRWYFKVKVQWHCRRSLMRQKAAAKSEACKICTLKILLPFSTAYLNASFMKRTPDFRLVVRKHHSYSVFCLWNINIQQLQVLLLYFSSLSSPLCTVGCFSWFGLQSAPRAQINPEQKCLRQTGLDFPVSGWYCASLIAIWRSLA